MKKMEGCSEWMLGCNSCYFSKLLVVRGERALTYGLKNGYIEIQRQARGGLDLATDEWKRVKDTM